MNELVKLSIAPGLPKDTDIAFNILMACKNDMLNRGIKQWNDNYPTPNLVEEDIRQKRLFLAYCDQELAGIITIDENQSPEYSAIPWEFGYDKILVVHRLAVAPDFQRRGIGHQLMDFAENYAAEKEYEAIRLDAYSLNEGTIQFYRKRGYVYRGDIFFPYRKAPFFCFEKAF